MKYIHRILFYFILGVSICWACASMFTHIFSLLYNLEIIKSIDYISTYDFEFIECIKYMYILGFTAIFWPMFYVEIIDYISSIRGENGKLYKAYAGSIQKDVIVSSISAIVLGSIYWLDSVSYSYAGIDLGFVGIPFLIHAIYTVFQVMNTKVAGKKLKKWPLIVWLAVTVLYMLLSYSVLLNNASGHFATYQSIWFQLTILFGSFFFFASANLQLQFVKNGKYELSLFKKYFFTDVIKSKYQCYSSLEAPLKQLTANTLIEKSKHSSALRKKGKNK